jgi:photosystem II stability/assembly factor-like uncharacterized protein
MDRRMFLQAAVIGLAVSPAAAFEGPTPAGRKANENPDAWQPVPISTKAQQTAGYGGGEGFQMIWGIKYAPSNPDIVYMVVDTSQVWKSTNGGASWQRKQKGFYASGGASVGVHPTDADIVFVAGGQMGTWKQLFPNRDGIYRTVDGGDSWQLVKAGLHFNRHDTGELFLFPSKDIVYAGTFDSGILKSTDNGQSWSTMVPFSTTGVVHDIKPHPDDASILFVSSANGYLKIEDKTGGVTVNAIGEGLASPLISVINKDNPGIIHAINGDDDRIYRSADEGKSFRVLFSNNTAKKTRRLVISPVDPDYMFVSYGPKSYGKNEEFYYTHDGGTTWRVPGSMDEKNVDGYVAGSLVSYPFDGGGGFERSPIAPHPTDRNIALTMGCPDHGTKTTDGGRNWRWSNRGYTGGAAILGYSRIAWDKNDPRRFVFGLTDMGGFLTEDGGRTFRNFKARYNGQAACHAVSLDPTPGSKVIVAACGHNYNGQILQVSRDNGLSWTRITDPDTHGLYKFVSFSPTDGNVVYASRYSYGPDSNGKLKHVPDSFLSTDKGHTWSRITRDGGPVHVKALFPGNGDVIYATSGGTIYKSGDRGRHWSTPYPSLAVTREGIDQIAVDPDDEDRLYAGVSGKGVYVVTKAEAKIRNKDHGIDLPYFGVYKTNWVAVDPNDPNIVYAAGWTGAWGHVDEAIFRSTDKGVTWHGITYNLAPTNVGTVSVNPHDGYVHVGTMHGTWKFPPPGAR